MKFMLGADLLPMDRVFLRAPTGEAVNAASGGGGGLFNQPLGMAYGYCWGGEAVEPHLMVVVGGGGGDEPCTGRDRGAHRIMFSLMKNQTLEQLTGQAVMVLTSTEIPVPSRV